MFCYIFHVNDNFMLSSLIITWAEFLLLCFFFFFTSKKHQPVSNFVTRSFYTCFFTDAHVGAWITIQKRPRVPPGHAANGHAKASLLLLRPGVPQQHRPSPCQTIERLQNSSNTLQAQARAKALHVPKVWQSVRRAWRLANAREELW